MKCDIRREDGTVAIALSGRIGVAEAVELRHRLFPELTAGGSGRLASDGRGHGPGQLGTRPVASFEEFVRRHRGDVRN
ncbi:hypothetical protein OMP38_31095 [Cohnella ginsengisoli]|uniref:Uncharacterized protein n=1 Tax=Cohnella ginsengisoli TaxID=425004 RepID=A0A9X4QPV5_9BACL|nr:hypothetical protein [Cohnella ginsengisoli]MDG0794779.1 hypothetical protein [Cohnella ginsengisoli]